MITSFRFFFVYEGLEILNLTTSQTKRRDYLTYEKVFQ